MDTSASSCDAALDSVLDQPGLVSRTQLTLLNHCRAHVSRAHVSRAHVHGAAGGGVWFMSWAKATRLDVGMVQMFRVFVAPIFLVDV